MTMRNESPDQVSAGVGGTEDNLTSSAHQQAEASDDEYLASLVGLLPEKDRLVVEVLERVKSVYVPCGRDKVLEKTFREFVRNMLAKRDGARDDGRAFFITGESGAGKTSAVRYMLSNHPAMAPQQRSFGTIKPVISVNMSGPCTLKILGRMILKEAGYPLTKKMEQGDLWYVMPEILHVKKVLIIHVDETQHMLKHTETDQERKNLAKALKGVMNYKPWPISFIMSGMPETTELSRLDEQNERRGVFAQLPDVAFPEERGLVERIVLGMCEAANMDTRKVLASDLPDRIAHAARYRYGRIAQVVLAAIHVALNQEETVLTREHFALAYLNHSHARGHDEMNPFLVDDWNRLEPGSFLIKSRDDR